MQPHGAPTHGEPIGLFVTRTAKSLGRSFDLALAAAAHGGFTTVCVMPNTMPAFDEPSVLARILAAAVASGSPVRLLAHGSVTAGRAGAQLAALGELADGKPVIVLLRGDDEVIAIDAEGAILAGPDGPRARVRRPRQHFPGATGYHRLIDDTGAILALTR